MQGKRIKGIILLAIVLVAGLLALSTYLLVEINNKQKILESQKSALTKLQNQVDYYKNQNSEHKDNKDSNYEIVIPEE